MREYGAQERRFFLSPHGHAHGHLSAKDCPRHRRGTRHRSCDRQPLSRRRLVGGAAHIEGELLRGAVAGIADPDNTLELHCDVSDAKAVAVAVASVSARFGRLDALVNNAGIAVFAPLLDTSDEDWSRILAGQPHRARLSAPRRPPP